jgi:hypothetical protein
MCLDGSAARGSRESVAVCVDDHLDAVSKVEFGEQVGYVGLNGSLAEGQLGGDFAVGQA